MNILEIAQESADICAVQRPTDLFNSSIQNDMLFASVVKSALSSLMRHAGWQALTREAVFRTFEGKKDYLIDDIAPDFHSLVNGTMYIKDDNQMTIGAITEEKWANEKLHSSSDRMFKIQNNMIRFIDDMGCKELHFTYKSNAVCMDGKTGEPKAQITKNTDIPIFDPYLVKLGIIWRWNKRSGMDYQEEFNEYQRELNKSFAETKAVGDIFLGGDLFEDDGVTINVKSCESCC